MIKVTVIGEFSADIDEPTESEVCDIIKKTIDTGIFRYLLRDIKIKAEKFEDWDE